MKTFPFGMPIQSLRQTDRSPKRVFVLGVYASAVHARWIRPDSSTAINALAVASEPEIFWRGENAAEVTARIPVPEAAGRLVPADERLNGPSGRALDESFLTPLGISRHDAWLCDLLPESRCNPAQAAALEREYTPLMESLGLPSYDFPPVPDILADKDRIREIEREIAEARPAVLITLGDQPLKWFTKHYGSKSRLAEYGESPDSYGRIHGIEIADRQLGLLPLVHPRQAEKLGNHSPKWHDLHAHWVDSVAPGLMADLQFNRSQRSTF